MPSTRKENERAFRKGAGRPSVLSPELTRKVCVQLRHGAYLETAAAVCGIDKRTLFSWLKQANDDRKAGKDDTIHVEFLRAVEEAQAESEHDDLELLSKVARKGNVHAITWRLERRNPRRWGPTRRVLDDEDDANTGTFRLAYSVDDDDEPTE